MGKSKNKNSKGGRGGGPPSSPSPFRGRGSPSGSGHGSRGGPQTNRGRGAPGSSFLQDELDFTVQMYADSPHPPQASSTANKYANSRGRGRGRGFSPAYRGYGSNFQGNGRGRGGFNPAYRGSGNNFQGNGRGRREFSANGQPGNAPVHGRGRGRGRGEGTGYSPRHGRGLGASTQSTPTKPGPKNSTLSNLLSASRPLLQPIKFVRAQHTPFLFQEEEELMQPIAEEAGVDEASHVPTADRIERIFCGAADPFDQSESSSSSEAEEEVEEVDFNNMGPLFDSPKQKQDPNYKAREADVNIERSSSQVNSGITEAHSQTTLSGTPMKFDDSTTEHPLFVVDTQPAPLPSSLGVREPEMPSDDEEIIVYVAPHPKISSRAPSTMPEGPSVEPANNTLNTSSFVPYTPSAVLSLASESLQDLSPPPPPQSVPIPEPQSVPTQAVSTTDAPPASSSAMQSVHNFKFEFSSSLNGATKSRAGRQLPSVMTPRMTKHQKAWERKRAKREREKTRKNGRRGSFAAFGAMVNDARLYEEDVLFGDGKDPKWEQRRKGDSDVEWGTEDEAEGGDENEDEKGAAEDVKSEKVKGKEKAMPQDDGIETDHGMQVDSEMEIDVAAMKSFVSGLIGGNASLHTTMEDLQIEERIRTEDAEGATGGAEGSSGDEGVESILDLEERLMIGDLDDDEDDESEDGFELSPKSSFQARLDRLREKSRRSKSVNRAAEGDESDEDEDLLEWNMSWAEESEDELIAHIKDLLEQNDDILQAHSRKERKKLFRAIHNGDFVDSQPAKKRKDKGNDLPENLREVWERDRQVKAERKRERERQKLITSMDPLTKKKGGKKGRKTMLKASSLDPTTINLGPNRVIDFTTLVQQIRRFVSSLGGPQSMTLPPANKWTRKNIHEVAYAFGLESVSKGNGAARYTTLNKTTRTGQRVNERKIASIMRRFGVDDSSEDDEFEFGDSKGRKAKKPPKHREGDEVGGSAPRLGQSNVGFKMLASMGWTEGERIGLSGGLEAPLVAVIKHSKLGLGAMK